MEETYHFWPTYSTKDDKLHELCMPYQVKHVRIFDHVQSMRKASRTSLIVVQGNCISLDMRTLNLTLGVSMAMKVHNGSLTSSLNSHSK